MAGTNTKQYQFKEGELDAAAIKRIDAFIAEERRISAGTTTTTPDGIKPSEAAKVRMLLEKYFDWLIVPSGGDVSGSDTISEVEELYRYMGGIPVDPDDSDAYDDDEDDSEDDDDEDSDD